MTSTTTLAEGFTVHGDLHAGEDIQLDGHLVGALDSDHGLTVGATGTIEGPVTARHVRVEGIVMGSISAAETVHVTASGQIAGDIRARGLSVEPGARIAGAVVTGVEVAINRFAATGARRSARPPVRAEKPAPTPTEDAPNPSVPAPEKKAPKRRSTSTAKKASSRSRKKTSRSTSKPTAPPLEVVEMSHEESLVVESEDTA